MPRRTGGGSGSKMSEIPDYTITIAVDRQHLEELRLSAVTWRAHRPEFFNKPWLFLSDGVSEKEIRDALGQLIELPPVRVAQVNPQWDYWGQREKMLSSFVFYAPHYVKTPYFLKLDVDAMATFPCPWLDPKWFAGNPVFVSQKWGYTKPGGWLDELDRWADIHPDERLRGGAAPHRVMGESVAKSARIISWCCFIQTEFAHRLASYCAPRLPVPSQDTTMWYVAERLGEHFARVRFPGWHHAGGNVRKMREIVRTFREIAEHEAERERLGLKSPRGI